MTRAGKLAIRIIVCKKVRYLCLTRSMGVIVLFFVISVWRPVGVVSDGNCYGFPVGVVCSVPVRREAGEWTIVSDLELTPTIQVTLHILLPHFF